MRNLPKLELTEIPKSTKNAEYGYKRDYSLNRILNDRDIFQEGGKRKMVEPVDHWRLSLKPIHNYESFPSEWLDDLKKLKIRVTNLKMDIHSVARRNSGLNI